MRSIHTLLQSNPHSFSKPEWQLLRAYGIVNGYGPRNSPILCWILKRIAPAFREANGNIHDVNYMKGGTEDDRKRADEGFFIRIIRDSLKTGWRQVYYLCLSLVFFGAVRFFGKKYFDYKYQCKKSSTRGGQA